jgi:hypothetical protein
LQKKRRCCDINVATADNLSYFYQQTAAKWPDAMSKLFCARTHSARIPFEPNCLLKE